MFDNPDQELKKLEDRLLALEGTPSPKPKPAKKAPVIRHPRRRATKQKPEQGESWHLIHSDSDGLVAALLLEFAVLMGVIAWWILTA